MEPRKQVTHIRCKARKRNNTPEGLAARLPKELQTFDNWQYSEDGQATGRPPISTL